MLREAGAEGGRGSRLRSRRSERGAGAQRRRPRLRGRRGAAPVPCRLRAFSPAVFERVFPRFPHMSRESVAACPPGAEVPWGARRSGFVSLSSTDEEDDS